MLLLANANQTNSVTAVSEQVNLAKVFVDRELHKMVKYLKIQHQLRK